MFVDNPCKVDNDTIIDIITWGTCDTIAALATSRLDENDKEKFQVLFVNDEVCFLQYSTTERWTHHLDRAILS